MTSPRHLLRLAGAAATALWAALLAVSLAAPAARANPYELFGFTPRAIGLAQSNVALGDDLSASFYNPAGMLGHTKTEFGFGLTDSVTSLTVTRSKLLPTPGYNLTTATSDNAPRMELALIFPLGGEVLKDRVVLGLNLGHPLGSLVRVQTLDQARPQFYMYQSKAQRFATSASIGVKIVDGLSIGAGFQVIAQQIGKVAFTLDLAAKKFTSREITVELDTIPEPIVGILVEPTDWLKVGFSWRKEASLYYEQPTDINLGALGDLQLDVRGTAQFWPHVFSLGVAARPNPQWTVTLQVDYLLWSRAPRDQAYVAVSPTGTVISGLGFDGVLSFAAADAKPGFVNILIPRVGFEWSPSEWMTARGGFSIRPPVTPDQVGTTNYLDNFTETIAGGATMRFLDPLKVFTDPVSLDVGGSVQIANPRTQNKSNPGDLTGSAEFGGVIVTLGAMLRYQY
jgi:long-subunit fatty acid transport protein